MALKSIGKERFRQLTRRVRQQLRFNAMDSGRFLERFDHVLQHPNLNLAAVVARRRNEKVADDSLAAFIYEEGIPNDAATFDGRVPRQDLRIYVAKDHLRRTTVVPGQQTSPACDFLVKQGTQIRR